MIAKGAVPRRDLRMGPVATRGVCVRGPHRWARPLAAGQVVGTCAYLAVGGIVLEHVLHVVEGDEGVVDGHNLNVGVGARSAHHKAANAAEACGAREARGDQQGTLCRRVKEPLGHHGQGSSNIAP